MENLRATEPALTRRRQEFKISDAQLGRKLSGERAGLSSESTIVCSCSAPPTYLLLIDVLALILMITGSLAK